MQTIAQTKASPFNLQIRIPDALKSDLGAFAGALGCYPRDVVTVAVEEFLRPEKKDLAVKLMRRLLTKDTQSNGKKR